MTRRHAEGLAARRESLRHAADRAREAGAAELLATLAVLRRLASQATPRQRERERARLRRRRITRALGAAGALAAIGGTAWWRATSGPPA
jgi:hypothetical protein